MMFVKLFANIFNFFVGNHFFGQFSLLFNLLMVLGLYFLMRPLHLARLFWFVVVWRSIIYGIRTLFRMVINSTVVTFFVFVQIKLLTDLFSCMPLQLCSFTMFCFVLILLSLIVVRPHYRFICCEMRSIILNKY